MDENDDDRARWNKRYDTKDYIFGEKPHEFLAKNLDLFPKGKALVLAMGEGQDAVFLAENGFEVEACDVSPKAVQKAEELARQKGVAIKAFEADLERFKLGLEKYDLITCFYYLQRDLIPQIKAALKQDGMVVIETFTVENLRLGFPGPRRKEFLLKENELSAFFRDLKVIIYRESVIDGRKAVASIIAQKIAPG